MGRVARYKKVKAFDPYSKQNGHGRRMMSLETVGVWGLGDNGRKAKKRSLTAQKLMAQKLKHKKKKEFKNTNGGNVNDFDIPPESDDDFDLNDLVGSLKPQKVVVPEEEEEDSQKVQVAAGNSQQKSLVSVVNDKLKAEEMSPSDTKKEPSDRKQQQQQASSSSLKATLPETDADEHRVAKLLNLEQQLSNSQKQKQQQHIDNMNRLPGESKNAYRRRVTMETRQIIKRETQQARNPEKRQRKKEFLTAKKKRKKGGSGSSAGGVGMLMKNGDGDLAHHADDNDDDDDVLCTGEQAYAARASHVPFGEQAERPPTFRQLPRGADKKMSQSSHNTLLTDGTGANPKVVLSTMAAQMLSSSRSPDNQYDAQTEREQAVELARRKAQAQYAMLKAKRKKAGEFHL